MANVASEAISEHLLWWHWQMPVYKDCQHTGSWKETGYNNKQQTTEQMLLALGSFFLTRLPAAFIHSPWRSIWMLNSFLCAVVNGLHSWRVRLGITTWFQGCPRRAWLERSTVLYMGTWISTVTCIYIHMVRTQGGFWGEEFGKATKRENNQYIYRHTKQSRKCLLESQLVQFLELKMW